MSTSSLVFLAIRAVHVLFAAVWVGATAFVALFLNALLAKSDRATAGSILTILGRRGLHAFMASIGGLTVLTGIWLYWRFTGHFDPQQSGTMGARVFGVGGVAGIIALIIGGSVIGRTVKAMTADAERGAALPDGSERDAITARIAAGRQRVSTASAIVLVLQIIALVLMAVGHYV